MKKICLPFRFNRYLFTDNYQQPNRLQHENQFNHNLLHCLCTMLFILLLYKFDRSCRHKQRFGIV